MAIGLGRIKERLLLLLAGIHPINQMGVYEGNAKIFSGTVFKMVYNGYCGCPRRTLLC